MTDTLITAENVGKKFCRDLRKSLWYGVTDSCGDVFSAGNSRHQLRKDEFWANQDISFELKRGECLALIGHNGAGKTTLLKLLSGLIKPDLGTITIRGKMSALIALGAGFNPILTARENIYINGSILGLGSKSITDRLDAIIELSGLDEFIDSPVRTFSSGMTVRLGFATAVLMIKPDVLLVDEVLSVGDAAFRVKSMSLISELLAFSAVVFVSHNEQLVRRACTKGLFLERGRICSSGSVGNVFEAYHRAYERILEANVSVHTAEGISGLKASITNCVEQGEGIEVSIEFTSDICVALSYLRLAIYSADHIILAEFNSSHYDDFLTIRLGVNSVSRNVKLPRLAVGIYWVSLLIHPAGEPNFIIWSDKAHKMRVTGKTNSNAPVII